MLVSVSPLCLLLRLPGASLSSLWRLASMVLGCMALGLCAMLGQGGVEYGEGRVLGCMSLGLCCHAR